MIPEELKQILKGAESDMAGSVQYCKSELTKIRAGKATPSILEQVKVEYYGSQTPLNQLANINAPEPRLLTVDPYDKSVINEIEKAIMSSGLGLNPGNDGNLIRIPLPMLSEERRKDLVKIAREIGENARISIRNFRRDANDEIKKRVKQDSLPEDSQFEAEQKIQELTDRMTKQIDDILDQKEKDILTV
ncbi:MAG: ribosome recycling factor [Balneolaceae bacterium]